MRESETQEPGIDIEMTLYAYDPQTIRTESKGNKVKIASILCEVEFHTDEYMSHYSRLSSEQPFAKISYPYRLNGIPESSLSDAGTRLEDKVLERIFSLIKHLGSRDLAKAIADELANSAHSIFEKIIYDSEQLFRCKIRVRSGHYCIPNRFAKENRNVWSYSHEVARKYDLTSDVIDNIRD